MLTEDIAIVSIINNNKSFYLLLLLSILNLMTLFKNKDINKILIITTFLFLTKWCLSFLFFNESLSVKLIFEGVADARYWYPYIQNLANLNFGNSFDPYIENLRSVPMPVGSLIFHAIFFKIFGLSGIIIIEFFAIFIFLFIFYKIFSLFFNNNESIVLSLLIFMIPVILKVSNLESFPYLNLFNENLFSLRPHRPITANLYFYSFIYLLISMNCHIIFEKKKLIALGILLGLSFASFYYFFLVEIFTFLFLLIYKLKSKIFNELINNYKNIIISIIFFLIFSSPFVMNLFYAESDLIERAGLFLLTIEKKSLLISYYLSQYLKYQFLLIFILATLCVYFSNKKKIKHVELLNVFFMIVIASIVSPIFFILVSPKSGLLYHFNNTIVVWTFMFFLIFLVISIKNYLKLNLKLALTNLLIISFIGIYFLNFYTEKKSHFENQNYKNKRIEFQKITEKLNKKKSIYKNNISLLTFDNELMIWSILNNIKYLNLVNGMWTGKTHEMIENDLIKNFKFLNLSEKDFLFFLKNEKKGWRYYNTNVGDFFHYRYTANSLNTYKDSKNFSSEIKKNILSSSPVLSQQIAIPDEEFDRLKEKFSKYKTKNFREPDIIVLKKTKPITKKIIIKKEKYCEFYDGEIYIFYLKKNPKINCKL